MSKENIVLGKKFPGELIEKWPKDQNNEYVEAAFLKTCTQWDMEDEILKGMLDGAGIPSFTRFHTMADLEILLLDKARKALISMFLKHSLKKLRNL